MEFLHRSPLEHHYIAALGFAVALAVVVVALAVAVDPSCRSVAAGPFLTQARTIQDEGFSFAF